MIDAHEVPERAPKGQKIIREVTIIVAHESLRVVHARCNEIQRALERVNDRASFKPGIEQVTFHGAVIR